MATKAKHLDHTDSDVGADEEKDDWIYQTKGKVWNKFFLQ